jgi:hypothetical protein
MPFRAKRVSFSSIFLGLSSASRESAGGELLCGLHQASAWIWPVPVGGSAYAETILPDAELEQGVSLLLWAIGWSGAFQAQFIHSSGGEHYLIDLNLRMYGTFPQPSLVWNSSL